jgi:hypothetical protein
MPDLRSENAVRLVHPQKGFQIVKKNNKKQTMMCVFGLKIFNFTILKYKEQFFVTKY